MGALLVIVLAIPLGAAGAALVGRPRLAEAVTLAAGVASFALVLVAGLAVRDGDVITAFRGWLHLDALGGVFLLTTGFVYAAASGFSIGYLRADEHRRDYAPFARRYFAYLNLFALTMLLVPLVADFGMLWIAVELTTIVSALLVALDRTDAALEAAWKYVLIASAGLGMALIAVILLYAAGAAALGDAYLPRFASYLSAAGSLSPTTAKLAFLLAAIGFGTKVGFVPVHTWLPDAHSEAPTPVSALLSGALLSSAFYALLRFYQVTAAVDGSDFPRRVLLVLGAASLLVAALYVLTQRSYKRLLAYSSVEHMGVIALGIGFGAPLAVFGALLHVINHAAAKSLGFFGAGSILRRFDSKEIDAVEGAAVRLPWSGPMFLAAALALSGVPLSGVFRSEFQIVSGGFAEPAYVGVAALIVLVNLAFLGVIWHVGRMVLTPASPEAPRGETSWWMVVAMVACLVVVVGLGLHLPASLSQLLHEAATSLTSPAP
jgi:hydrogenase-4 component F